MQEVDLQNLQGQRIDFPKKMLGRLLNILNPEGGGTLKGGMLIRHEKKNKTNQELY